MGDMTHHQQDGGPLNPYAISVVRTLVPLLWGYAASSLIALGLPASLLSTANYMATGGLTLLLTGGWYAAWRWLETKLPRLDSWAAHLAVVLALGHPATPSYTTPPVVNMPADDTVVMPPVSPPTGSGG